MGYDKQRFLNMLAMGMCSKARVGTKLPPSVYLAASQWQRQDDPIEPGPYIVFTSAEPFTLSKNPRFNGYEPLKCWDGTLYYSTDADTWAEWDGTSISSAMHGRTHRLYMRGKNNSRLTGTWSSESLRRHWLLSGSNISCDGNIENLLDYELVENSQHPVISEYCFAYLFRECSGLIKAPELPLVSLTNYCYMRMFEGCTSLVTAPILPATRLTTACYNGMFSGCTSLVTAPELPALSLKDSCYAYMFEGCASLTTAPELRSNFMYTSCYDHMFSGCTSLVTAPKLPATRVTDSCYYSMFSGCTSLVTAPELPATTMSKNCYFRMFSGCTSLVTAPELPATTLAAWCYQAMFLGCTSLTTVHVLPRYKDEQSCYDAMYSGCTSIKVSETRTEEYTVAYSIVADYDSSVKDMFENTGGTFTGTPSINTTYYLHNSNTVI